MPHGKPPCARKAHDVQVNPAAIRRIYGDSIAERERLKGPITHIHDNLARTGPVATRDLEGSQLILAHCLIAIDFDNCVVPMRQVPARVVGRAQLESRDIRQMLDGCRNRRGKRIDDKGVIGKSLCICAVEEGSTDQIIGLIYGDYPQHADENTQDGEQSSSFTTRDISQRLTQQGARGDLLDTMPIEKCDPSSGLRRQFVGMGDIHDRFAVVRQTGECLKDFVGRAGVEIPGRFVGNDHGRIVGQRAGDGHALLFSAGEFTGKTPGEVCNLGQSQAGHGAFTPMSPFQTTATPQFQSEKYVLQGGECRK